MISESKRLLTREESAELLGMSLTWVKDEIRAERLPVVRLGRMVRIDRQDLEDYIQRHKRVGTSVGSMCGRVESEGFEATWQVVEKTEADR